MIHDKSKNKFQKLLKEIHYCQSFSNTNYYIIMKSYVNNNY